MTQAILKFKLQSTNEKLTPRTGIAILGEYPNYEIELQPKRDADQIHHNSK